MGSLGLPELLVILVLFGAIPAFWKILNRVGKSPLWSLIAIWPLVGTFVLLYYIAFSKWKNEEHPIEVKNP